MKKTGKKKSKKKVIAFTSVGIVAAAVGGMALYGSAMQNSTKAEESRQTVKVEKRDLQQKVTVTGTVESAETSTLTSDIVGVEVKSVKVKVGDRVKKGDIIAELDDTDLITQQTEAEKALENAKTSTDITLNAAQRSYDDAVADKNTKSARGSRGIDDAQNEYNKAVEDQTKAYDSYNDAVADRIAADDTYAEAAAAAAEADEAVNGLKEAAKAAKEAADKAGEEFDKAALNEETTAEELNAAKTARDEAKAAQKEADDALSEAQTQLTKLNNYASICAQEASSALMAEKELYAGLSSADKMVEQAKSATQSAADAKSDVDREYDKAIAQSQDALDTAKLNGDESLSAPQKQLDDINKKISKCVIKAECDGVVTSVSVKEGDIYSGGEIAVVRDDSRYKISAGVDQYDIAKISKDMDADITVQALSKEPLDGKLTFVSPIPSEPQVSMDGTKSATSYPVEAELNESKDGLRIGMSAKLTVITEEKKNVLAVPESCIMSDDSGWYIQVQGEGNEVENIYVEKGLATDYYTEISGAKVTEGMEIIEPEDESDSTAAFY